MITDNRLDMLLLGTTGFAGMHCIPYLHKLTKSDGRNLTWGVAGRSEEKIKEVLEKMGKKAGADLSNIPIIICDIKDPDSILKMAKRTKIVINCCGPYQFLGEAVVKACIEAGAHHIDFSGEPQYMEKIELDYNQAAINKGVYVVSACGFDSVPAEFGILYLQNHFEGVLNSVVMYLEIWGEGDNGIKSFLNFGTWSSIVHGYGTWDTIQDIRKKLYPNKLPPFIPKHKMRFFPHKPSVVNGWSLPFVGADRSVTRRTQRYFYDKESKRPVQIDAQFILKSYLYVIAFGIFGAIFVALAKFSFGRKLLLKYPSFFTGGLFNSDQPSEDQIDNVWIRWTFYGEGWKDEVKDQNGQYTTRPNKAIIGKVEGRNPGYRITCASVVGAAIMIATEKHKLPNNGNGGVYTPGAAFAKTSFTDLLIENCLTFEIISQKDI